MSEVASLAGVTRPTVSGVLSRRADCRVSAQTRRRVEDAVRTLGYRPNLAAKALVTGQTGMIGLISTALDVDPTARTCLTLEALARDHGFMTIMSFNPNDPVMEDRLIHWLHDRAVDGVIVFPAEHGTHAELKNLVDEGFAVVTIDGHGRLGFATDDASVDHFAGGRLQGEHLLSLGRRRICIANSSMSCYVVDQRIAGLEQALGEAGCPRPLRMDLPFSARPAPNSTGNEKQFVRDVLRRHQGQFDGIAAVGDDLALMVMGLAIQSGMAVPGDVAIVGFDGIPAADNTLMPLSTVVNPARAVARAAFELLTERLNADATDRGPRQVSIEPKLIARASTLGHAAAAAEPATVEGGMT